MKKTYSLPIFLLSCMFCLSALPLIGKSSGRTTHHLKDSITKGRIAEERFIKINGIEQWVTIKGDRSKPVILFIHGGPGSPLSPYADAIYSAWERDFVLVQWDQRGAGKTYGRTAPPELSPEYLKANPLTVDQIANDGIAVAEYIIKYLGKKKITLTGTSWGSVPAVEMAAKRPDLFNAYVGHSQIVKPAIGLVEQYHELLQTVQKANDKESEGILKTIGAPPYDAGRDAGKLFRIIKKYERLNSVAAPDAWWKMSAAYDNETDNRTRADGDDYSFVNYVGDKKLGVAPMMPTINFMRDHFTFKIPIYLIQGENDILTPAKFTKPYFDKIKAPKKQYILVPNAAHGFNEAIIAEQYKIFKAINKVQ